MYISIARADDMVSEATGNKVTFPWGYANNSRR